MSIKKILLAGVAGTFLASNAMAAEPLTLSDAQLDDVSAGVLNLTLGLAALGDFGTLGVSSSGGTVLSQMATSEQTAITGGGQLIQSLIEVQAAAGIEAFATSVNGGGVMFSDGGLALSGTLSVPNITFP